jgi:TldD protein
MSRGADFAEVYAERTERTGVSLEEERVRSSQFGVDQGVGIRAISGAKVGYAYSDDLEPAALEMAARTAAHIAAAPREPIPTKLRRIATPTHYRVVEPLAQAAIERKVDLVVRGDRAARRYDSRIKQVSASYADQTRSICVGNTNGHFAQDVQDLCRLNFQVVAVGKNGERRTGFYGGGGRVDIRFYDSFTPEDAALEATFSKPTSSAKAPRSSPASSARESPPSWSPSSTTAPSLTPAAPSTSTTRASPPSGRSSSKTACCAAT